MKTWYNIKAAEREGKRVAEVSIHDEIGAWGVPARNFMAELKALGQVDEIKLSIHSPGGEVLDGWAIYNTLQASKANITARVEGMAASMASVILMAADRVEMPENAYIMIHEPWGLAVGDADEMRETADFLDKLGNGIVRAYTERTGETEEDIRQMMKAETWMDGQEALEKGFADFLLAPAKVAATITTNKFANMPKTLLAKKSAAEEEEEEAKRKAAEEQEEEEARKSKKAEEDEPEDSEEEEDAKKGKKSKKAEKEDTEDSEDDEAEDKKAKSFLDRALAALTGSNVSEVQAKLDAANTEIAALKARVAELEPKAAERDQIAAKVAEVESSVNQRAAEQVARAGFAPEDESTLPSIEEGDVDVLARYNAAMPAERSEMAKDPALWAKIRLAAANANKH